MPAYKRSHRPLLRGGSALGLTAAAGVAFAALLPLTRDRELHAFAGAPDMLALSYLELALTRAPDDPALRVRVAERILAAGQFARARETLAPLFERDMARPSDADLLLVEVEFRAWAAADPNDADARQTALSRLIATLQTTRDERLSALQAERVASVCAEVGLPELRARILGRIARADLASSPRLAAADAAYLEAEDPLTAAHLQAERSLAHPEKNGAMHAALALERALGAEQPGEALVLFRKLGHRYPDDPRVLELGLSVLAGVDDATALAVAQRLIAMRPGDAALRRRIAELSAWTAPNRSGRAVAWGPPARALRWDASEGRELELAPPENAARAIELTVLLESLGAPHRALAMLQTALAHDLVDERVLWDLEVGVLLRLGRKREALDTLAQMDDRFGPTRESLLSRADLSLSLGELEAALELLDSAPGPRVVEDERRVTAIGWELGNIPRVRAAYRVIAVSAEATTDDVRRLWLLEREGGDLVASAQAALSGWRELKDPDLLSLALHTAVESKDDAVLASVLVEARAASAQLAERPEDLRLQVNVRHGRAHQALLRADHARARAELAQSAELLAQARAHAAELGAAYRDLWQTQDRQRLDLALAENDRAMLARVYPEQAKRLSPRERVHVLHRLGRDEEAVDEAVANLSDGDLPEADRAALQGDAAALSADMPRQISVLGDVLEMPGLTAARVGANARYALGKGRRVGAQVELTRLGSWDGPSLYLTGTDELAAELSGGLEESLLTLGVVVLDGRAPRPLLRFEQELLHDQGVTFGLSARVNDRSRDTPELRLLGVEDELAAHASVGVFEQFWLSGRGAAKLYSDRDRHYLGAGATLDAALGRSFPLPQGIGNANVRVAGYAAPRFAADAGNEVPDGAGWMGLGASLSRGQISAAPVAGRRLSVLADATLGWLVPRDELGWSGKLGLGISVLGADQLSVLASASNAVSTAPGFAVYSLGADYAVSQW